MGISCFNEIIKIPRGISVASLRRPFDGKKNERISKKLQRGLSLKARLGHTVHLEETQESLIVHTGLSFFYMPETLRVIKILDEHVPQKG